MYTMPEPVGPTRAWVRLAITLILALVARARGQEVVYVSGPMRGYDFFNYPAFDRASRWLRERGYYVISPAELGEVRGWTGPDAWNRYMTRDCIATPFAQTIVLLDGHEGSKGGQAELYVAKTCGAAVRYYREGPAGLARLYEAPPQPELGRVDVTYTIVTSKPGTNGAELVPAHPALVRRLADGVVGGVLGRRVSYSDTEAGIPPTEVAVEGPVIHAAWATQGDPQAPSGPMAAYDAALMEHAIAKAST
jgi:hypothetical protein